jgi:hypothetical protein
MSFAVRLVRTAVEELGVTPQGAGRGIDGLPGHTLKRQGV